MRLIDCCLKILAYTACLRRDLNRINPAYDDVRQDFEKMWAEAQTKAGSGGLAPDDFQEAKFAVCAWVDETIMLSTWAGRTQWAANTLQRQYFNTANAGEEFFVRLEKVPAENPAVREVYATCLGLGFLGRYWSEERKAELEEIKQAQLGWLARRDGQPSPFEEEIIPEAYPPAPDRRQRRWVWGRLDPLTVILFLLPPVLAATLFVIFRFLLSRAAYDFFQALP
ncbi:MAG: DotU family type IV/VI secretion system protein [Thermodesulfobacteriota bacterium]